MRLVRLAGLVLLASAACGFPRPADVKAEEGDFTVTLASPRVRVVEGAIAAVGVTLGRNVFTDAVKVTIAGLPAGVTVDPLTIEGDTGTLTLHAAADATQGDAALTVTATGGTRSHDTPFSLLAMGPSGTLDRSFSSGGMLSTPPAGQGAGVVIQPDGKMIIVGTTMRATQDILVARYLSDGSLDPGFSGGVVAFDATTMQDAGAAVALQPDGKIVVAGTFSSGGGDSHGLVVRLNASGSPDTDFGTLGVVRLELNAVGAPMATMLRAVAVQPDGGIVVAGRAMATATDFDAVVARLAPTGVLDVSFGNRGRTKGPFGPGANMFAALALQADGRIVAAGSGSPSSGSPIVAALARFDTGGGLDNSFSADGILTINKGDALHGVSVEPDGKIIAVGLKDIGICLVRMNSDGSPDVGLGTDGVKLVMLGSETSGGATGSGGFALQPDGKFVISGSVLNGTTFDAVVARFGTSGVLDLGFAGGFLMYRLDALNFFLSIALDSDGRIVSTGFTGSSFDPAGQKVLLARFWP
jgi:uncharacterized delta-60 repeat protein